MSIGQMVRVITLHWLGRNTYAHIAYEAAAQSPIYQSNSPAILHQICMKSLSCLPVTIKLHCYTTAPYAASLTYSNSQTLNCCSAKQDRHARY